LLAEDFYFAASSERRELQNLIEGYRTKLEQVSAQFNSLGFTRARTHKLRLANASLRLFNLDAARNYDASLSDMRLEVKLLAEQVSGTSQAAQVAGLESAIAAKESERRQLESEVSQAKTDVAEQRPRLEAALKSALEQKESLSNQLRSFEQRKEQDYAAQRRDIAALQERIGAQVLTNTSLQGQVDKRKRSNAALQAALQETRASLEAARKAYDAEVGAGLAALEGLQSDLRLKSRGFLQQFLQLQTSTEICANIDARVGMDLLCRTCMQLLEDPVILWPCGHTLCRKCVGTTETLGALVPPLPPGAPQGLVCTECAHNFHNPPAVDEDDDDDIDDDDEEADAQSIGGRSSVRRQHRLRRRRGATGNNNGEGGGGAEDVSFPNPYIDPPPNFRGVFYAARNVLLDRLLGAYKAASKQLANMLPRFEQMSLSVDVFARYNAQQQQQQQQQDGVGISSSGRNDSHLHKLLSEAERRVDRGELNNLRSGRASTSATTVMAATQARSSAQK
jgi:hypothetical protein